MPRLAIVLAVVLAACTSDSASTDAPGHTLYKGATCTGDSPECPPNETLRRNSKQCEDDEWCAEGCEEKPRRCP